MSSNVVSQVAAGKGPCRAHSGGGFIPAWGKLGLNVSNATIVNLGATLGRGGLRNSHSNEDQAWELFFQQKHRPFRMVAFEGSEKAFRETNLLFNQSGGRYELDDAMRYRVQFLNSYVHSSTIVNMLHSMYVPHAFELLKIDMDSVDFEAFVAITQRFHPQLVFVERTDWLHAEGMVFTALTQGAEQTVPAEYGKGTTGYNFRSRFACQGASSRMWLTYARQLHKGYRVVQWDGGKNYLLARNEAFHKFVDADDSACFMVPAPPNSEQSLRAIAFIDHWCNHTKTPYYVEHDGVCCHTNGSLHLSRCRCSFITDHASYMKGGVHILKYLEKQRLVFSHPKVTPFGVNHTSNV